MKKFISIMTIAALFAVSCDKATVGAPAEVEVVTPGLVKYTLTVNKPEDTKVAVDAEGALTWEGGEILTISCDAWDQSYQSEPVAASAAGAKVAEVVFTAPEHEGAEVYVSLGSVSASVEGSQSPVLKGVASVEGAAEGQTGSVTLSPAAAHFRFTDIPSGVQSIKIAAVGGESVANEEAKLITVKNPGTTCGVNILPETYTKGLVLAFEGSNDAIIKSLSYNKELTLGASSLRNISLSGASTVQLAGTVTPVTTYTNKDNDLSKRLKIYGASVTDFAASNLSASLADFVSLAGYTCEEKTATTDGVFADDFTVGNHTVVAAYNFVCGPLTVSLGSLEGTAVITGIPYNTSKEVYGIGMNNGEWEQKNGGKYEINNNPKYLRIGSNGSVTMTLHIPSEIKTSVSYRIDEYLSTRLNYCKTKFSAGNTTILDTNDGGTATTKKYESSTDITFKSNANTVIVSQNNGDTPTWRSSHPQLYYVSISYK